jgi:enterochelin esterase-like enzyme
LDYKILVDGITWLVDPANPHQQASGLGPNSELQMLDYVPSRWTSRRSFVTPGRLTPPSFGDILARPLGYIVDFQIYLPVDYQNLENLPVIYVLDGHEYSDEDLGALTVILDNLIAAGEIEPVMAVFIDPRDEDDKSINRRETEYAENDAFQEFLVQNLIPFIDENYSTDPRPESRLLLGTSLGGRAALYYGVKEAFGLVAAQSPSADPANTTFFSAIQTSETAPVRIWMSAGAPEWDVDTTPLRAALLTKGYSVEYVQVN